MGCVHSKHKKTPVGVIQPSVVPPEVTAGPSYFNQQSTVTRTAMPLPNGSHMYGPPPVLQPIPMQNSAVRMPPLQPTYQPPAPPLSAVIPPLEIAREPVIQPPIGMQAGPNVGRQPLIKQGNQLVQVPAQLKDAARGLSYTPVQINPMGGPSYDLNSNYAMEATMAGGVNTIMDQRVMDLDMDMGASSHTPKIYTYTYGNMMSTGGPLLGVPGLVGQRAAAS